MKGNVLHFFRNTSKHLFRKNQSFGFNLNFLENALGVDKIIINVDDKDTIITSRKLILEKGEILFFKQQGFEKQIFVPIKELYNVN